MARHKPAAKTAIKKGPDSVAPALKADSRYPEVHTDRHPSSGLQEMPTAGVQQTDKSEPPGAGAKQVEVDPQPSIGVTHDEREATGPGVNTPDEDAEYVYTYEQALSLPVVDKGTAQKMPSEAQIKALHAKQEKAAKKSAQDEADRQNRAAQAPATTVAPADVNVQKRVPIVSFKDRDRRTMVVVKTKDGLGAMPTKEFKDMPAPNAA